MIKVLFVCLGNICRSPMAEAIFKKMVKDEGLENIIFIDSAATSSYEIGNPVHYGTKNRLKKENISVEGMFSRQLSKEDMYFDYIIGMDKNNIHNIKQFFGKNIKSEVKLLLEYAGKDKEIDDPWYTGNFDKTYNDIFEGCSELLKYIKKHNL